MLPFHLPSISWSKSTLSSLLGWLSSVSLYTSHKICPIAISSRVSSLGTFMEKLNCLRLLSRVIPPVSGGVTVLSKRYRSLYRNIRTFHLKHQNLSFETSEPFDENIRIFWMEPLHLYLRLPEFAPTARLFEPYDKAIPKREKYTGREEPIRYHNPKLRLHSHRCI